jgi:hypothetical protein
MFLEQLKTNNELLFWFGAANALLAIVFLLLSYITPTQVLGINAWIKPFKFALSISIYTWTMAWFINYLPHFNKSLFSWSVVILLGFEIIYIAVQAARGQLSHFNVSTPAYRVLYGLMAVAATAVSVYTAYVGVLFFTSKLPQLPVYYLWSIRLGILLFVIFSFEGFLMGAKLSHSVGGPDGSIGLPLTNWSVQYGDLRIAHFVGMHAMQVLPLLSFYVLRNNVLTILVAFFYTMLAFAVLIIALQGKPIIKANQYETKTLAAY